jgi:hypothetical protein
MCLFSTAHYKLINMRPLINRLRVIDVSDLRLQLCAIGDESSALLRRCQPCLSLQRAIRFDRSDSGTSRSSVLLSSITGVTRPNCLGSILHFVFRAWAQGHLLVITVCSHDDGRNAHRDGRYADSWREPVASRLPRTADWHSSGIGYNHDFDFLPHFASVLGAQLTTYGVSELLRSIYDSHPAGVSIFPASAVFRRREMAMKASRSSRP